MKPEEKIDVYIDIKHGETVCICKRSKKMCNKDCETDTVTRDRFEGWYSTLYRNQYGK